MKQTEPPILDGNAAGGAFAAIFAAEPTSAVITCQGCGRSAVLAEQAVYLAGPGIVVRCSNCDSVLARIVRTTKDTWLELQGSLSWRFLDTTIELAQPEGAIR